MNLETKRGKIEDIARQTRQAQSDAADPTASAWVNANAGTGKTHVLTQRVLRLLLAGTEPQKILCLTYTKAAAAEMSTRVFARLSGWVTATDDALARNLEDLTGVKPDAAGLAFARTLFAVAIETPGGLKVQTIHAFAERVLQRFPLEAGVPPDFRILDDEAVGELKGRAIERTLREATGESQSPLGRALDLVVRYASDEMFDKLIGTAVDERRWMGNAAPQDDAALEALLRTELGIGAKVSRDSVLNKCAGVLSQNDINDLANALSNGGAADQRFAASLKLAARETAGALTERLAGYFLANLGDKKERPRDTLVTRAVAAERPDLVALATRAQERFIPLYQEARALALIEASVALHRLSGAALLYYAEARSAAGALDFADLILKTLALLKDRSTADWILFKLDGGLDHILVDEAQDTSPEQWEIVATLATEFFSGIGRGDGTARTLFAVGDEKQSIYSFQGAAPEKFAATGKRFADLARAALQPWRNVRLNLSFRSVPPVLDAVDRVFADDDRTPGLRAGGDYAQHIAQRAGHAGLIEIWPTEKADETTPADPWDPLSELSERAPANRLAERIADTIDGWRRTGEMLASEGRPIRAGDILILVRKRNPFAIPMVAALKRRGIPVAGADRIALVEQIAVADLVALGDFLTLPEDDLALASVLKGPLFGLTDDDLLAIAPKRKATLWRALLDAGQDSLFYAGAAETLKRWRAKADFTPPFEFFSSLLDREGGRQKMLGRLGPESADAIDEFLDLALNYDERGPPSMTLFLADLRSAERQVKRDMEHGRDEVRVLTVHGAKGLEAPIVFLPDTCSTVSGDISTASIVKLSGLGGSLGSPDPLVWAVKGTSRVGVIETSREQRNKRETDERNRLLYVAMTRARDRLYVGGFETKRGKTNGCWYDCIAEALQSRLSEVDLGNARRGWRLETAQTVPPQAPDKNAIAAEVASALPAFAMTRVTAEPKLSIPLAPSRLEPYAPDAEGEPLVKPRAKDFVGAESSSPIAGGSPNRFLRGNLTHALLQHLPGISLDKREAVATAFVAQRGGALNARARESIVSETLKILSAANFAPLFGAGSLAEVPIAAVLPRARGKGPALDLSGQIDRLAVTSSEVFIVDYKTNRPPPKTLDGVAAAYLYQLAAYATALAEIYPGKLIRAALLWTDGPQLMEIPRELLDRFASKLWDLDAQSLDAS